MSRVFAEIRIVPDAELMSDDDILSQQIVLRHLHQLPNPLDVIKWLARRGLLRNRVYCPPCQAFKSFVRRPDIRDGYHWKCKFCRKTSTIRAGSFFSESNLTLRQMLTIIYCWAYDFPQCIMAREVELGGANTHTVIDWANSCRAVCEFHLMDNPMTIGGLNEDCTPKVVEVGESQFFHRKYHRGQWKEGHWVFGGIERESGKCFLVEVPDRKQETLENVIERYILPGTIIVSNGSQRYNNIGQLGNGVYEHEVLTQENGAHADDSSTKSQNVEGMWLMAKRKLTRQCGTSEHLFESYLHEFVWRNKFRGSGNIFGSFLISIKGQYPPASEWSNLASAAKGEISPGGKG